MATIDRVSPFIMHGARDALAAGLAHIEAQVEGIEQSVLENPALTFDLARTLIESVCRTILTDRKIEFREDDDLPRLFKSVCTCLPFLPVETSAEPEARRSLAQTLNGLGTVIHGICELRNHCGFASHGSDKPRPVMEAVQALMAAEAADTIIGFLHRVHRQDRVAPLTPLRMYESNPEFNSYVDEAYGPVQIFASEFKASEILFQMEPQSYRIYLADFDEAVEGVSSEESAESEIES